MIFDHSCFAVFAVGFLFGKIEGTVASPLLGVLQQFQEFFMPRGYRHIQNYEKEILELRAQGKTRREICEKFGFSIKQMENFITNYNRRQEKIAAGIAIKKKGRPAKDSIVTEEDKLADLRYKLTRKDARIKQLEMENELMRDFLSLTERK